MPKIHLTCARCGVVAFFDSPRQAASFGWRIDERTHRSECIACHHFWALTKGPHTATCDASRALSAFELRLVVDGGVVRSQVIRDSSLIEREASRLRLGFQDLGWKTRRGDASDRATRLERFRDLRRLFHEAHADGMRSARDGDVDALRDAVRRQTAIVHQHVSMVDLQRSIVDGHVESIRAACHQCWGTGWVCADHNGLTKGHLLDDGGVCGGIGSPCDDPGCPIARCA